MWMPRRSGGSASVLSDVSASCADREALVERNHGADLPEVTWRSTPLAIVQRAVLGQLLPAVTARDVEVPDVAALQQIERPADMVLTIELGASGLAERLEPGGIHEVGDEHAVDGVSERVVFARITHFVRVQASDRSIAVLDEDREIDIRISEHLEQF